MSNTSRSHAWRMLAENAVARGVRGAVACTARSAAVAGISALERGGSAVDAALAACLAETVLMPSKCGLAGELVAMLLPAGASEPRALIAVGPAPADLAEHVMRHGLPQTGAVSVAVPAAPAGYAALAGESRLGLAAATAPAAALAATGFVWSALCARLAAQADDLLLTHQPQGCVYRPLNGPLRVGEVVRLPGMAQLLREYGSVGPQLFVGPGGATAAGAALVQRVRGAGGVLTEADLAAAQAQWVEPAVLELGADTVYATPEPTYGTALLDALRLATATPAVAMTEAIATATAKAPEDPIMVDGTSAVAAVDAEGTAVVVVHSNSFPQFGSGLVLDDFDLVLSNRPGRGFSPHPESPNAVRSGARPATTLHAWMVSGRDRPATLGGTSGGEHQVEWNAQFLAGLLTEPERELSTVMLDSRWERASGTIRHEDWHSVDPADRPVGSSHAVVRRGGPGEAVLAVADPRLGATAVGV